MEIYRKDENRWKYIEIIRKIWKYIENIYKERILQNIEIYGQPRKYDNIWKHMEKYWEYCKILKNTVFWEPGPRKGDPMRTRTLGAQGRIFMDFVSTRSPFLPYSVPGCPVGLPHHVSCFVSWCRRMLVSSCAPVRRWATFLKFCSRCTNGQRCASNHVDANKIYGRGLRQNDEMW